MELIKHVQKNWTIAKAVKVQDLTSVFFEAFEAFVDVFVGIEVSIFEFYFFVIINKYVLYQGGYYWFFWGVVTVKGSSGNMSFIDYFGNADFGNAFFFEKFE